MWIGKLIQCLRPLVFILQIENVDFEVINCYKQNKNWKSKKHILINNKIRIKKVMIGLDTYLSFRNCRFNWSAFWNSGLYVPYDFPYCYRNWTTNSYCDRVKNINKKWTILLKFNRLLKWIAQSFLSSAKV